MKNIIINFLLIYSFCLNAQVASIKIDISRIKGEIDPMIYGVFMEPINFSGKRFGLPDTAYFSTMYGTLYDPSSTLANEVGFRKDYIDAMRELKITNMRWPGGNFLMAYDWKDGIGPKDQRPVRINLAWGGLETNQVGTDEWIALNKAIGSENVICVNLGLGTIMDACHWVEYCNYKKGTYYSNLRAKNGNPEPYNVKIWGLGNEVDGEPWELGYKNADDYVKLAREAAKAMRSVDKSIKLVASGSSYYEPTGRWVDWNWKILTGLGDVVEYISIHRYWERSDDYYTFMGQSAMDFEEKIKVTASLIYAARVMKNFKKPIYIAVDEWGIMARNFLSVLPIAQCFNSFIRNADIVKMANFTMLTSLLQEEKGKGTFKTPLFYTFKLFSNNCYGYYVDTYVECDTFSTVNYKGIPYLDVTSVFNKQTNTLYINVVNRHKDKEITSEIQSITGEFTGKALLTLVYQESLTEAFTYDKRNNYIPLTKEISVDKNKLKLTFPPHSFTQIKVELKGKK